MNIDLENNPFPFSLWEKGGELKQRTKTIFSNISNCYIITGDWVYRSKKWRYEAIFHLLQVGRNICLNWYALSQENGFIFLYFHVDLAWKSLHISDVFLISLHRSLTLLHCCLRPCVYKTCRYQLTVIAYIVDNFLYSFAYTF